MKVGGSIQKRCINCKIVLRKGKRGGKVPQIICSNRRHRQRQG